MSNGRYKPWEIRFIKARIKRGWNNDQIMTAMFDEAPASYRGDYSMAHKITELKKKHGIGKLGNRAKFPTLPKSETTWEVSIPTKKRGKGRPPKSFDNIDPMIKDVLNHIVRTFEKKGIRTSC